MQGRQSQLLEVHQGRQGVSTGSQAPGNGFAKTI